MKHYDHYFYHSSDEHKLLEFRRKFEIVGSISKNVRDSVAEHIQVLYENVELDFHTETEDEYWNSFFDLINENVDRFFDEWIHYETDSRDMKPDRALLADEDLTEEELVNRNLHKMIEGTL